jgi:hypothetical protein
LAWQQFSSLWEQLTSWPEPPFGIRRSAQRKLDRPYPTYPQTVPRISPGKLNDLSWQVTPYLRPKTPTSYTGRLIRPFIGRFLRPPRPVGTCSNKIHKARPKLSENLGLGLSKLYLREPIGDQSTAVRSMSSVTSRPLTSTPQISNGVKFPHKVIRRWQYFIWPICRDYAFEKGQDKATCPPKFCFNRNVAVRKEQRRLTEKGLRDVVSYQIEDPTSRRFSATQGWCKAGNSAFPGPCVSGCQKMAP